MKKHAFHQHFRPFRCIKHCKLQCFVLIFFQKPPPHGVPEMLYQFFTFFRAHAKKRHECPTSIFLQFSGVHKFRISSSSRFTSFNFVHLWGEGQCMDGWTNGWTNCKLADTILILNTVLILVPSLTFHYPRQGTGSRSVSSPHHRSPAQDPANAPLSLHTLQRLKCGAKQCSCNML